MSPRPEAPRRREQALALAAVVEAALLVDQLARQGSAPAEAMESLSHGLFVFEWQAVEDVFGGVGPLARGLEALAEMLRSGTSTHHPQALRYTLALLHLSRLLLRDRARLAAIREALEHASIKSQHFATRFDELAASLAGIYQQQVSTLRYRIQVAGSATQLQDPRVAERIRALLLAGLRAAVLWRGLGGSRLDLLLARGQLLTACEELRVSSRH